MTQGISISELPPVEAVGLQVPSSLGQLLLPRPGKMSKAVVCLLRNEQTPSRIGKYLLTQAQHNISGCVCVYERQRKSPLI